MGLSATSRYVFQYALTNCRDGHDWSGRNSLDATSRALGAGNPDLDKQMHFHKIQEISDSTTLPQMLVELGKGLDRVANVDAIVSDLRHAFLDI